MQTSDTVGSAEHPQNAATQTNGSKYEYEAYVDASGDDGFKFSDRKGEGSSLFFAVAVVAMPSGSVEPNLQILQEMKRVVGVKPNDEIKFASIKNHRKRPQIISLLCSMRCQVVAWVAAKPRIKDPICRNPKKKLLLRMVHAFPISSLSGVKAYQSKRIRVYVDKQKMVEDEKGINSLLSMLNTDAAVPKEDAPALDVSFEDSKRVHLLQAADLFAGAVREYLEQYERKPHKLPCVACTRVRTLCRHWRTRTLPGDSQEFAKVLRSMIAGDSGGVLLSGLTFYPFELNNTHYHFIDCLFFKRGPLRYK